MTISKHKIFRQNSAETIARIVVKVYFEYDQTSGFVNTRQSSLLGEGFP